MPDRDHGDALAGFVRYNAIGEQGNAPRVIQSSEQEPVPGPSCSHDSGPDSLGSILLFRRLCGDPTSAASHSASIATRSGAKR